MNSTTITIQHDPHDPNEHSQPSFRCYTAPREEGGMLGWMLVGHWTEQEIAEVNAALVRYPLPKDQYSPQYWYLRKTPGMGSFTYTIVQTIRGNASLASPLHSESLTELLRIWESIEQNTHGTPIG